MDANQQQQQRVGGHRLINEAIKRILLDIVVRGHGDRLIGRWSREPELQEFLEQVPYMLDRINQLHLACTRTEHLKAGHVQHHYHASRHHQQEEPQDEQEEATGSRQTSLSDFINLVGPDLHWLVRTRDALGLTPLHKAVLFNNRPIVEYILDRYPEELAPATWRHCKTIAQPTTPTKNGGCGGGSTLRLIDAQDKYGRTALHYAAAHLGQSPAAAHEQERQFYTISHLYHFLVSKGASMRLADFKGRTAPHYVRHPNELRLKSIIHLSNKLNANYQANVLSKTLRAAANGSHDHLTGCRPFLNQQEMVSLAECVAGADRSGGSIDQRESMSVSCTDLTAAAAAAAAAAGPDNCKLQATKLPITKSHSTFHGRRQHQQTSEELAQGEPTTTTTATTTTTKQLELQLAPTNQLTPTLKPSKLSFISDCNGISSQRPESFGGSDTTSASTMSFEHLSQHDEQQALKQLRLERGHQILGQKDKIRLKRCLNEGIVEKINQLLVEGWGDCLAAQANVSCWNQQCRRYINKVIPDKLDKLDQLHELIARNQLLAIRSLLQQEPILARMLRPYRRASLNSLHLAVYFGRKVLVKYLAENFPELVQRRDSQGATCLHWAARSLRRDRLYCWLLDRYGAQLEQLRDLRGKSAADYRQQALRLSTYSESHPAPRQPHAGAREILDQTRDLSNRLLSLSGTRAKLNEHPPPPARVSSRTRTSPGPSSLPLDSAGNKFRAYDSTKLNEDQAEQQQILHRLISSASTGSRSPTTADSRECRLSESTTASKHHYDPQQQQQPLGSSSRSSSTRQSRCGDNTFLGEFADFNANDEKTSIAAPTTCTIPECNGGGGARDSPLATPTLPHPIASSMARPESASSGRRLDLMIIDSIKAGDYKKLEHLILAGCGERLLRVYHELADGRKRGGGGEEEEEEEEKGYGDGKMQEFAEKTVPEYMEKIAKIYDVLHRCYVGRGEQNAAVVSGGKRVVDATNSMFHKLCNLLDRKRLIMSRDSHGACPLHVALLRSDRRLVEYLLRRHPEAASAPDHESRTALHYAAIVLASHRKHGTFKLTCKRGHENTTDNHDDDINDHRDGRMVGDGFWLVDEEAQLTYDKLCARYGELLGAKDRRGLTCGQYLLDGQQGVSHARLADDYSSTRCEAAKVFAKCCPEYGQLLSRYNYCLLFDSLASNQPNNSESDDGGEQSKEAIVVQPTIVQQQQQFATEAHGDDDHIEVVTTTAPQTVVEDLATDNDGERKSQKLVLSDDQKDHDTMRRSPAESSANSQRRMRNAVSPMASDLVRNGQLIASQLAAPPPPPQSPTVRQVAPKPIVGSGHDYAPTISTAAGAHHRHHSSSPSTSHHHHSASHSSLLGSHRRHLIGDVAADQELVTSPSAGKHQHQHHHHRHHHHNRNRHRHHRRGHSLVRRAHRPTIEDSLVSKPLVGGVIVPTIIHNDKMDEIETYDIIYRQPPIAPSSGMQSAVSQESIAGLSLSSSSSSCSSSSCFSLVAAPTHLSPGPVSAAEAPQANDQEPTKAHDSPSCSSGDDDGASNDEDDDDDDERVERLSDEFESRVRREKSELRAKVDQIMSEIKMSAKSGKSSRFLASPLNNNDNDNDEDNDNSSNQVGTSAMLALNGTTNNRQQAAGAATNERQQSLSSSGPHSCSSSGSLSVSRTTSAASSTSSSSTASSSSSSSSRSSHSSSSSSAAASKILQTPPISGQTNTPLTSAQQSNKQQQAGAGAGAAAANGELSSKNTYGQTYLHFIASRPQNASTLYKVLRHGSYLIGERDIFYRTARDVAIQFNLSQNVQILDKFIIDLFVEGKLQLLRHLLNQGYSPLIHVSDTDGNDIMLILKLLKLDRMIHFLLQMADFQRWRDELHTFIRNGYSGGVSELLLKHKDLVRAKSVHARTSLHLAVLFDRPGMVEELIGADPLSVHVPDNMGRTALHYTYGLQSLTNIELIRDKLLAAGAKLDARDVKMRTPKYYYIFKREIEEIKRIELELN